MIIKDITSIDNEKIKHLKKLGQKKYRDSSGQFCVENLYIIYDAIRANYIPESLFLCKKNIDQDSEEVAYILRHVKKYYLINERVNKNFSSLTTPSGICAIYNKPKARLSLGKNIIYLNNIKDPGNMGTILRTALAFRFCDIVIDEGCVDVYNPKVVSAAKDAILKLQISEDDNMKIMEKIKNRMTIYASSLDARDDIDAIEKDNNFCIVFGNESIGVSDKILDFADKQVKIEMSNDIESLNVAISAGIILHKLAS